MYEYDRLHHQCGSGSGSGSGKPVARLRLFLFAPSIGGGKFHDGAPLVTSQPAVESVTVPAPITEKAAPDYLFGLENEFPPLPAPEYAGFPDPPPARSEIESVMQRHVNEIQRLQIAENNHNLQVNSNNNNMKRNGSDETLARVYPGEYYAPRVQEQTPQVQNRPTGPIINGAWFFQMDGSPPSPVAEVSSSISSRRLTASTRRLTSSEGR